MARADSTPPAGTSQPPPTGTADSRERWPWRAREEALLELLRKGRAQKTACALLEIPRSSYYEAKEADPEFGQRCDQAISEWECRMLDVIEEAAMPDEESRGDWKAAGWLLEKRIPKRYGKQAPEAAKKVEHSGPGGSPLSVQLGDAVRIAREAKKG